MIADPRCAGKKGEPYYGMRRVQCNVVYLGAMRLAARAAAVCVIPEPQSMLPPGDQ